jgi:hypothetical protein
MISHDSVITLGVVLRPFLVENFQWAWIRFSSIAGLFLVASVTCRHPSSALFCSFVVVVVIVGLSCHVIVWPLITAKLCKSGVPAPAYVWRRTGTCAFASGVIVSSKEYSQCVLLHCFRMWFKFKLVNLRCVLSSRTAANDPYYIFKRRVCGYALHSWLSVMEIWVLYQMNANDDFKTE